MVRHARVRIYIMWRVRLCSSIWADTQGLWARCLLSGALAHPSFRLEQVFGAVRCVGGCSAVRWRVQCGALAGAAACLFRSAWAGR